MSIAENPTPFPTLTLGWRLRMALEHADVKVNTMADELGVARTTLGRWLHDTGAPPRDGFVKLIALRTKVPYEWIKNGIESTETGPEQGGPMSTWSAEVVPFRAREASATAARVAA